MRRCSFSSVCIFFSSSCFMMVFLLYVYRIIMMCSLSGIVGVPPYRTDVSWSNMFSYFLPSNISLCVSLLSNVMVLSRHDNDNAVRLFFSRQYIYIHTEVLVLLLLLEDWIERIIIERKRKTDESSYLILIFQNE